jgi:hypothetical protein
VQPSGPVQHVFERLYVYGTVELTTGDRFFPALPYLSAEHFQLFVDMFAQAFPDRLNLCCWTTVGRVWMSRDSFDGSGTGPWRGVGVILQSQVGPVGKSRGNGS